jgi:Type I phosphodiesterase / nucleotide pyrophosphatase
MATFNEFKGSRMNLSRCRREPRIIQWLHLCLSICLLFSLPKASQGQKGSDRKREFLEKYAHAYYPGRSGQIMLVPREGDFVTLNEPASLFMHGSPWSYDADIPLLFFGPSFIRKGTYAEAAAQQDIVPTLAKLLRLPLPPTVTGRAMEKALRLSASRPRAILVVVLDGMRRDYFERYQEVLPTLTRLREGGAWFSNARVNFLPTITPLGHATIGTGADPRVHGIVVNTAFDGISGKPQSPYPGMSPRTLMALTLADLWNLETDGQAVIIGQGSIFVAAAGLVGHGACLLNARATILASYSPQGAWETNSECYKLPQYLQSQKSAPLWEAAHGRWMGHDIASPEAVSRSALFPKFEADALVPMIENERVGADDLTDLLLVNLKAADFVGHRYGPDSPEMRDTLAEQDRQLARILETLDKKTGANRFVVVITADHGMPPEPQAPRKRYFNKDIVDLVHRKFDPERATLVTHFDARNNQLFVDKNRLRELGLKLSQIKEYLEAQPFIYSAYTEDEIKNVSLR